MGTQSSNVLRNSTLLKGILVFLSIVVIWKIVTLGVAQWYEQQILNDDDAVAKSLAWVPDQPGVLFRASQLNPNDEKDKISELLQRSLNGNPSDGRVLLSLGHILLDQNEISLADEIVNQATESLPNDAYTHIEASSFWLRRNKLDNAIKSWNVVLQTTPKLKSRIFPLLLSWVEDGILKKSLNNLVLSPPVWWQEFFEYAAKNASRIATLDQLYNLRRQSPTEISQKERKAYVTRLQKEGLWSEAFLAWLNGLGPQGLKYMGQPYNGGFETPLTQSGFGWNFDKISGVLVGAEHTFGNQGQRALHFVFQGENRPYKHFYQTLFLAPARYRLTGSVRPDSLISTGGLRWKLRCLTTSSRAHFGENLGKSERFLGVGQWRRFSLEFEILDSNCEAQDLRLESEVKGRGNDVMSGEIWFDSMVIERI